MAVFDRDGATLTELLPLLLVVLLAIGPALRPRGTLGRLLAEILGPRELNALIREIREILAARLQEEVLRGLQTLRT